MKAIFTLKSYFFKRTALSRSKAVSGELKLDNGKELILYFLPEEGIIEVTHKENKTEVFSLDEEERIAVIEAILEEYTTFLKSIFHASIALYLESFILVDTTNVKDNDNVEYDIEGKKNIMTEYLNSKYSKFTSNLLFRNLLDINEYLKEQKENAIGTNIEIKGKLSFKQWFDLKYFVNYILCKNNLDQKIDFTVDKKLAIIAFTKRN